MHLLIYASIEWCICRAMLVIQLLDVLLVCMSSSTLSACMTQHKHGPTDAQMSHWVAHVSQELIRELAGILLRLSDNSDTAVDDSLRRLTIDTSTLMGCMKQFNVPVYKAALQGRIDQHLYPTTDNTLDAAWFSSLPVGSSLTSCCLIADWLQSNC